MSKLVIGLTGSMGCGKGEIVKILEKKGFKYVTLSMMVREEARKRGVEEERENLMGVGNSMRKEGGAGVLAQRALVKINSSEDDLWIVDGIRNPAEIDELKKGENVHVVGVSTDKDVLVERIMSRARESDSKDRAGILHRIEREWGVGEPEDGQQVGKCMEKVDILIPNMGTLEELEERFYKFYEEVSGE